MSKVPATRKSRTSAQRLVSPVAILDGEGKEAQEENDAQVEAEKLFVRLLSDSVLQQVNACRSLASLVRVDTYVSRALAEREELARVPLRLLDQGTVEQRIIATQALNACCVVSSACADAFSRLHAMNAVVALLWDVSLSKVQMDDEKQATEYVLSLVTLATNLASYSLMGAEQIAAAHHGELCRFLLGLTMNDHMTRELQAAVLSLLLVMSEDNAPFADLCQTGGGSLVEQSQQELAPLSQILGEMANTDDPLRKATACAILLNVSAGWENVRGLWEDSISELCKLVVASIQTVPQLISTLQDETTVMHACEAIDALILALETLASVAVADRGLCECLVGAYRDNDLSANAWAHVQWARQYMQTTTHSEEPDAKLDSDASLDEQERSERRRQHMLQPLESRVADVVERCVVFVSNVLQGMESTQHGLNEEVLFSEGNSVLRQLLKRLATQELTAQERAVVLGHVGSACNLLWQLSKRMTEIGGYPELKEDLQGLLMLVRLDCGTEIRVAALGVVSEVSRQAKWFSYNFVTCTALLEVLNQYLVARENRCHEPVHAGGLEIVAAVLHACIDIYSEDELHRKVLVDTKLLDVLELKVLPQFQADVEQFADAQRKKSVADDAVVEHLCETLDITARFIAYKRDNP